VEPGGLWDADRYEVMAILKKNGEPAGEIEMKYAGTVSRFSGVVAVSEPGAYEATVYAHDPSNGNTGLDRVTFIVTE
jgi:hypothetical protein